MNARELPKRIMLGMIRFYRRRLSPNMPPACRFSPTCSVYAIEAIEAYGAFRGGVMAFCRILRCNPFHRGGHDPVPRPDRWQDFDTPAQLIHGGTFRP